MDSEEEVKDQEIVTENIIIGEAVVDSEAVTEDEDVVSAIDVADPSENEIDQKFPTLDVTDIDDGLLD